MESLLSCHRARPLERQLFGGTGGGGVGPANVMIADAVLFKVEAVTVTLCLTDNELGAV